LPPTIKTGLNNNITNRPTLFNDSIVLCYLFFTILKNTLKLHENIFEEYFGAERENNGFTINENIVILKLTR